MTFGLKYEFFFFFGKNLNFLKCFARLSWLLLRSVLQRKNLETFEYIQAYFEMTEIDIPLVDWDFLFFFQSEEVIIQTLGADYVISAESFWPKFFQLYKH